MSFIPEEVGRLSSRDSVDRAGFLKARGGLDGGGSTVLFGAQLSHPDFFHGVNLFYAHIEF